MKAQITEEKKESGIGTFFVYAVAVLYIALGIAFLVVPELKVEHLCYLLAVCLILLGVIRIGEYFIRECYKNINQYGFSIGVFAIILGVCVIIRIDQFTAIFNLCLGIGILLTAIIKIQNAMDLRALEDRGFLIFLIAAVLMVIGAAVILINPFGTEATRDQFTYIVLIIDGGLSITSTTYLMLRIRGYKKHINREAEAKKSVDENIQQEQITAEAPEVADNPEEPTGSAEEIINDREV